MKALVILATYLVLYPIEFFKTVWHIQQTQHTIRYRMYDFRLEVRCRNCGCEFVDELKDGDQ